MKPAPPKEQDEQRVVAQWLDLHRILYCHVPNGGARSRIEAAIFAGIGVKKGVPDFLIFRRPVPKNLTDEIPAGVAVEMKRKEGGKVSAEQAKWIADLTAEGWICKVCEGADEALNFLREVYGKR